MTNRASTETTPPKRVLIDGLSIGVMASALLLAAASAALMILSMNGGFLGILLGWCLAGVVVIPLACAARCLFVRSTRCRWRPLWAGLSLLITGPLFLTISWSIFVTWRNNPVFDLESISPEQFSHTRIEFHGGENPTVIHDPHNCLRFCFGGKPGEVRIEGNERVYIFTHGVIIKSWTDDIELSENATGIGGWMGADLPPGEAVWIGPDGRYQNPPER